MAVDNPSYFSLCGEGSAVTSPVVGSSSGTTKGIGAFFRRKYKMGSVSSVAAAPTPQKIPTSGSIFVGEERVPILPNASLPATGAPRRSFRSLFRSVSASADSEKTRQFLKGDPRPSDVAPPSPYLPHRSHSHSENDRRKTGRRKMMKSASELLGNDMIFCESRSTSRNGHKAEDDYEDHEDYYQYEKDDRNNDVFLGVEDARYYNISTTLPSASSILGRRKPRQQRRRRRHSIGTFLERDRCVVTGRDCNGVSRKTRTNTRPELVVEPDIEAPPVPMLGTCDVVDSAGPETQEARYRSIPTIKKRGTRHAAMSPSKTDSSAKDDVVFISSKDNEASALWVNYLTVCFEQISRQQGRPPFRVSHVSFEDPLPPSTEVKIRNARLQIVVVCPVLLEQVTERPEQSTNISKNLIADKVLAMMLGVHDVNLNVKHRSNLVSYENWKKFFVKDQDETFVGQFLGAAVAILGNSNTNSLKVDKTAFSIHPKKVKTGQSRVIALLNDPLLPEDNVTVLVDRCGEAIEVSHVKRRNPYALQFSIPDRCLDVSMLVGVRIAKNGTPLGVRQVKCESRLRELDQILRAHDNPLEFLCQTIGFNPGDREKLDNWMVHAFQQNVPPHFNLLSNPNRETPFSKNQSSSEENPTLLHFAARFGLEKLAWQLLECPGGEIACDLKNFADLTPADLAEQAGHCKLGHQLRGYMQMNEFTNMYSYLKVMSENANETHATPGHRTPQNDRFLPTSEEDPKEDYCCPKPLSEAYSVPPAARPVKPTANSSLDLSIPPPLPLPNPPCDTNTSELKNMTGSSRSASSSTLTLSSNGLDLPLQGYMQMQPTGPKTPGSVATTPSISSRSIASTPQQESQFIDIRNDISDKHVKASFERSTSISSNKSRENSGPEDELLEIINDFKNNVFTISEVERLVENWRNRNDVRQSFKDKQRQLTAMRDEYERIQKRFKDQMKAPTPFDRIRKFFTKGKKDSQKDAASTSEESTVSKTNNVNGGLADRRPVSSLSLHSVSSSSSSGRMSTVSGCSGTSLGDSGTHSDTEDRRLQNPVEDKSGMTSYEIPPAPKPFLGRYSPGRCTPSQRVIAGSSELDLRATKPVQNVQNDIEYYIAFPPSGLPIHSFNADGTAREPKTPGTPSEQNTCSDFPLVRNQDPMGPSNVEQIKSNRSIAHIDPPPGMCIPLEYMNVTTWEISKMTSPSASKKLPAIDTTQKNQDPKQEAPKISTSASESAEMNQSPSNSIQVDSKTNEIVSEEPTSTKLENESKTENGKFHNDENESKNFHRLKILPEEVQVVECTPKKVQETQSLPEYTNVTISSMREDIARNFGVKLKKLPGPPVPPRCEFNFANSHANGIKE